jgi:SAM-dependent methyltransferase
MNSLFHDYYDVFYAAKDYSRETDTIVNCCKSHLDNLPDVAIEIGCGTGNHTVQLASRFQRVIAVDIDEQMVLRAQKKTAHLPNVEVVHGSIDRLVQPVSLITALFNVVTYLQDLDSLDAFFHSISRLLTPGGLFVFDAWNGVAALRDLPQQKHSQYSVDDSIITLSVIPELELMKQNVHLTFEVTVSRNGEIIQRGTHRFLQKLWMPMEITWMLKKQGLHLEMVAAADNPQQGATQDCWKVLYVCRKI